MDDDKFKKLLRKAGEQTTRDYPKNLEQRRRNMFSRWVTARTSGGCLAVIFVVLAVIYMYGRIVGWW